MTRGVKPTPAPLRIVKGTNKANAGRENPDIPDVPANSLGSPPLELTVEAAEVWTTYLPYWAGAADREQFAAYCTAVADARHFWAVCEKEGWYFVAKTGNPLRHPASTLYHESRQFALKLACEFGLTPTSRVRIKAPPKKGPSPSDEFRK